MAADYTSGSASSFSDVMTALENFLVLNGWTAQAGPAAGGGYLAQRILSKGLMVYRLAVGSGSTPEFHVMGATGISGSATTGDAPSSVRMVSSPRAPITFPINYEIFWNDTPEEVYVVIAYGGNKYQHINFGTSDQPGIGGTGAWITGSARGNGGSMDINYGKVFINYSAGGSGDAYMQVTPYGGFGCGFFLEVGYTGNQGSFIHCGLEGADSWRQPSGTVGQLTKEPKGTDLLAWLPSQYNEAEVLLPIFGVQSRTDGLQTIVLSPRHSRFCRIDNQEPGSIITYGGDQWKVYPLYAKNVTERNGIGWATGTDHSGTFGVAIRYPGA